MVIFAASFISGVMLGVEVKFLEPKAPYVYSIVVDLLIIRFVLQKYKHVR
jgi:hypothetical protein